MFHLICIDVRSQLRSVHGVMQEVCDFVNSWQKFADTSGLLPELLIIFMVYCVLV